MSGFAAHRPRRTRSVRPTPGGVVLTGKAPHSKCGGRKPMGVRIPPPPFAETPRAGTHDPGSPIHPGLPAHPETPVQPKHPSSLNTQTPRAPLRPPPGLSSVRRPESAVQSPPPSARPARPTRPRPGFANSSRFDKYSPGLARRESGKFPLNARVAGANVWRIAPVAHTERTD